jgi:hypothetical protein
MTKAEKQAKERAALKAELKAEVLAELKEAAKPRKPFVPDPTWQDQMHQMREARMSLATPPSVVRDMAVLDDALVKGIALRDARAPTGPSSQGAIPSSQQVSNVRGANVAGSGTGWSREIPLGPPPGVVQADRLMDAADARDRAELVEREAKFKAMQKLAEGTKP